MTAGEQLILLGKSVMIFTFYNMQLKQSRTLRTTENNINVKMTKEKLYFFTQSMWIDKLSELVFLVHRIRKKFHFLILNDLLICDFWLYQIRTAFIMMNQTFLFFILTCSRKFIIVLIFLQLAWFEHLMIFKCVDKFTFIKYSYYW